MKNIGNRIKDIGNLKNVFFDISMTKKIFTAPLIGIFIILILGTIFYLALKKQKNTSDYMYEKGFFVYQESLKVNNKILLIHSNMYKLLVWKQTNFGDEQIRKTSKQQLIVLKKVIIDINKIIKSDKLNTEGNKFFKNALQLTEDYKINVDTVLSSIEGEELTGATMLMGMCDDSFSNLNKSLQGFLNRTKLENDELKRDADTSFDNFITTVILVIFTAIILFLVVTIASTRLIIKPIKNTINVLKDISEGEGDLTVHLEQKSNDEMGQLCLYYNNFVSKINGIIVNVTINTETVLEASSNIANVSQDLSDSSTNQASNMEEISSSMTEMVSTIYQNSNNSKKTNEIAQKTAHKAEDGGKAVEETVNAMRNIVEKIIFIQEIAYQTNLLALNASIEAANAGEHGKGFAVVAGEVRKLAEKSQKAANEISDLAKSSLDISEKAGKLLEEIVPDIQETANLVQEITLSSNEQNTGAEQINVGMDQLNELTQSNAASSEELTSTAEMLKSNAEKLYELVNVFKVNK